MEVKLAAGKPFCNEHDAQAGWTAQAGWLGWIGACGCAEQRTAAFKCCASPAVGEETEVPNANQAAGQNM